MSTGENVGPFAWFGWLERDRPYECRYCGSRLELEHYVCPMCGSFSVDRRSATR